MQTLKKINRHIIENKIYIKNSQNFLKLPNNLQKSEKK